MKRATITEAKNGLSALIDQVRAGESVLILDRGIPVARLEPVIDQRGASGRLQRLVRAGMVRPARTPPAIDLIRTPGPRPTPGTSAVDMLIEERRSGR